MFPDESKTLVRQQNPEDDPGRYADSCWETSNWQHSCDSVGIPCEAGLTSFMTTKGFIRHPKVPDDWKETDFSEDQGRALWFGCVKTKPWIQDVIYRTVKANYFRWGNGNFVSPGMFGELMGWQWLAILGLLAQWLVFKIGIRWSDSKKWFERDVSAADMISWMHAAVGKPKWVRELIKPQALKEALAKYYAPEPNSAWLVSIHEKMVDKYYG